MAMREDGRDLRRLAVTVPADPAGRLLDLLTSLSMLRKDGQILVDQIRGSIREMRELRSRLRTQQPARFQALTNGAEDRAAKLRYHYGLTRREVQVAVLLAQGRSNSAIAKELKISPHTARHHTQHVLSKLHVHSRSEAGAKIRD
jgi:DNA-binding NarL/FixJ family response regulator